MHSNIITALATLTTALAAILALLLTSKQIRTSNKQFLFNKRINNYMKVLNLIELYKDNQKLLDNKKIDIKTLFFYLTNSEYLNNITKTIKHPNNNKRIKFLLKMEELNKIATEIRLTYTKDLESAKLLSNFIIYYKDLLLNIYKYQLTKDNKNTIYNIINNLNNTYNNIINTNAIYNIEQRIKLN